jgi:hypothetical protein
LRRFGVDLFGFVGTGWCFHTSMLAYSGHLVSPSVFD